ncbi:MAG: hypothetical protein R2798_02775 [Chitinophagales bacterium]|nr:hypothetical protein [Bacteroidota bacterium]MCB9042253.1 hypothetical protein [Chitinophagales bacterium]
MKKIITIVLLLLPGWLLGQNKPNAAKKNHPFDVIKKEEINLSVTATKIYETKFGKVYFYTTNKEVKNIEQGYFKGFRIEESQNGIKIKNKNIGLSSQEIPLFINGSFLFTKKIFLDTTYYTELRKYSIGKTDINLIDKIRINNIEINLLVEEKNGHIAISDCSEGYGTYVKVYDANFKEILNYFPFNKEGYADVHYSFDGDNIGIVSTNNDRTETKISFISLCDNELIFESFLNTSFVSNIKVSSEKLLIYYADAENIRTISCFESTGNILWKIYKNTQQHIIAPYVCNNFLYNYNQDTLSVIDLKNGKEIWKKSVSSYLKNKIENQKYLLLDLISENNDDIFLIVGKGNTNNKKEIFFDDLIMIQLNEFGNKINSFNIDGHTNNAYLSFFESKLYLLIDKKLEIYEKK